MICKDCEDTGMRDTGGVQPWGEPIFVPCECTDDDDAPEKIDRIKEID